MKYIVTNDQETAEALQKLKFGKDLRQKVKSNRLIRDSDKKTIDVSKKSDLDLVNEGFVIYGECDGKRVYDKGRTTGWARPKQRDSDRKWIIKWHEDFNSIKTDLKYTVEEYSKDWWDTSK